MRLRRHLSPEEQETYSYRRGEMTGVWVSAAVLFGIVAVILIIALRS